MMMAVLLLAVPVLSVTLPDNYSVRSKGCSVEVLDQGHCGSCWSFGSSEAVSDRFCLMGYNITLSPQSLVSCPTCKGTCGGGADSNAYSYMAATGLQTCTDACTTGCEPYGSGHTNKSCTTDPNKDKCHGCDKMCHDGKKATLYKVDKNSIMSSGLDGTDEKKVMMEIATHGSVTGGLSVYSNWQGWVKKHGADAVYDSHENSTHEGAHSIKIIGFGTSSGKKYWLVQNSWGKGFGDHGTIKMLRGQNVSIPGGDRCLWNKVRWATPLKPTAAIHQQPWHAAPQPAANTDWVSDVVTGGWSVGNHRHSYWRDMAREVFAAAKLAAIHGAFEFLEKVESQVTNGFNARFTIVSTTGVRAVIFSSHGSEDRMLTAPTVESME